MTPLIVLGLSLASSVTAGGVGLASSGREASGIMIGS
jgi:hypothetical protein